MHRDLKPENIFILDPSNLINVQSKDPDYLFKNKCVIKIADLGFIRALDLKKKNEEASQE